jgi:hypothetical protein
MWSTTKSETLTESSIDHLGIGVMYVHDRVVQMKISLGGCPPAEFQLMFTGQVFSFPTMPSHRANGRAELVKNRFPAIISVWPWRILVLLELEAK